MSDSFSYEEGVEKKPAGGKEKAESFSYENAMGRPDPKGFGGHLRDTGLSLLKGAISVPEAAVGLVDIPAGGRVGKFLENDGGLVGFRPGEAKEILSGFHTDQYKDQLQKFQDADGIWDKTKTAVQNPSLIANTVVESLPGMGAGGVAARGLLGATRLGNAGRAASAAKEAATPAMRAAAARNAAAAGAIGEGSVMAGMQTSEIRGQTDDGLITPEQAGYAVATGALGTLFGYAGGRLAQKLGIGDVDTMLARGVTPEQVAADLANTPAKSIPRQIVEGAITEGFLEELPQSVSETILQNLALDKDWWEGVDEAIVMGTLAGMAMGGVGAGYSGLARRNGTVSEQAGAEPVDPVAPNDPGRPGVFGGPVPDASIDMGQMQDGGVTPAPVFNQEDIERNLGPTPSEQMGIDPNTGPLSTAAAIAVDTGTGQQMARQDALAEAAEVANAQESTAGEGSSEQAATAAALQANITAAEDNLAFIDSVAADTGWTQKLLDDREAAQSQLDGLRRKAFDGRTGFNESTPEQRSPEQQAQYIWDSMNTFERNAAAANVLGMRGVPAKNAATKSWDKLSTEQRAKLVTGLESQQGKRWIDPNQKVTDQTGPVLQNRDRTSQDSINQMRSISNNPDYSRLKTSGFLSDGAPVVIDENIQIPASQMGVADTASAGSERFNVQYAVVEADQLMTSNSIDGATNAEYQTGAAGKARAIAGNGRITGLQSAWAKGNANQYKADMAADRMHGIDPSVIEGMRNPILVRLLPQDQVTDNIGDLSNRDEKARLSPVEQAKTDMGRIDLDSLKFTADGAIGGEAIHQFRMAQPAAERVTEAEARKRLTSAIFQKAYGNDQLTEIQSGESDDAKSIMSALAQAAPSMSRLEGAGEFDIRPLIAQAGIAAVNAARRGTKLADYVQQSEMGIDPMVYPILEMMLNEHGNIRSSKYIGEQLTNMAKLAYDEANSPSSDMFGEKPKRTGEQVIQDAITGVQGYGQINDGRGQESLGQRGRSEPDAQMAEGPEGGRERPADTRQATPTQPTESAGSEPGESQRPGDWETQSISATKGAHDLGIDSVSVLPPVVVAEDTPASKERNRNERIQKFQQDGYEVLTELFESYDSAVSRAASLNSSRDGNIYHVRQVGFGVLDDGGNVAILRKPATVNYTPGSEVNQVAVGQRWQTPSGEVITVEAVENTAKPGMTNDQSRRRQRATFNIKGNRETYLLSAMDNYLLLGSDTKQSAGAESEAWRTNYIRAAKVARDLGIDPKQHKKLADLVAAIDAFNAEPVASQPQQQAKEQAKPALELNQQTEESLAKDAERLEQLQKEEAAQKAAQKAAESKQRERDADKARADEVVDDFQLGQSAEEAMSGMGDIFDSSPSADKPEATSAATTQDIGGDAPSATRQPADAGETFERGGREWSAEARPGKGLIKGKFIPYLNGKSTPGGPFDTAEAAIEHAKSYAGRVLEGEANAQRDQARMKAVRGKVERGEELSKPDLDFLNLREGSSDLRWFIPNAARLFGLTSRKVRPLVSDLIRVSHNDMGTKFESVPTNRALQQMANALRDEAAPSAASAGAETKAKDAEAKAAQPAPAPIEDAGEKLGGARKDELRTVRERLDDMSDEAIASSKLSELWPKGEVDRITDPFHAAAYHAVRAYIPTKPRATYRVKRWVDQVKAARGLLQDLADIGADASVAKMRETSPSLNILADQIELLMGIDRAHWSRVSDAKIRNGRYSQDGEMVPGSWVELKIDKRSTSFYGHDSIASALPAINQILDSKPVAEKKQKFSIYTRTATGEVFISADADRERRALKLFESTGEARKYLDDHHGDLVAAWEAVKNRENVTKSDMRRSVNEARVGQDYRGGKDVTPEQFLDHFGFRGVEFGNWVKQGKGGQERQGILNDAYDAFMDLAGVIGVPPKALSLEGRLGIGFGSRGRGGSHAAHYEPGRMVINLTKTKGAGSLAHEWFHAMDNYFAHKRGVPEFKGDNDAYRKGAFVTYRPEPMLVNKKHPSMRMTRAQLSRYQAKHPNAPLYAEESWERDASHPEGVRPVVEKAFAELVQTLDASPMTRRSSIIDKGKVDGYWSQIIERGARAFETYVIARLADQGARNDYLANVQTLEEFSRDPGRYPYLTSDEQGPVNEAFDKLFSTIETQQTDSGDVVMFSFAGRRSGTAMHKKLDEAIRQTAMGINPEQVRQDTGWHRGVDGKWRYEISDADAELKVSGKNAGDLIDMATLDALTDNRKQATVGDLMNHPKLFAAYPQLADIVVQKMDNPTRTAVASVRVTGNQMVISLNPRTRGDYVASALIHELQHAIQTIEGFARGGNARMASRLANLSVSDKAATNVYMRLAGEIEARNTQARMKMDDEFRKLFPPSETADVSDADAIVTFNGTEAADFTAREPITELELKTVFAARFPKLTKALDRMLEKGAKRESGGLVILKNADPLKIARKFSQITGRNLSDAIRMFDGANDAQGFYDPRTGLTFLVGPSVTEANAAAVVLHEAVHGQQNKRLDQAAVQMLVNRKKEGDKNTRDFLDRVVRRMARAEGGVVEQEAAAYIVEQAILEGRDTGGHSAIDGKLMTWIENNLGKTIADLVRDFVKAYRKFALRHGLPLKVTIDDMIDYAQASMKQSAKEGASSTQGAAAFSRDEADGMPPEREGFTRMYHGGGRGITAVLPNEGRFGALFASTDPDRASGVSLIEQEYFADIADNKILTNYDLNYSLDHDQVRPAFEKVARVKEGDDHYDLVWSAVVEDSNVFDMDEAGVLEAFLADDLGEASWEAQKLRGRLAAELGYQAVEVNDEHGTSHMILPGVKLRPVPRRGDTSFSRSGQTQTPEFKRWFGDSKIVDADGNPLVVYHGTKHDFTEFQLGSADRRDGGWFGDGFYLTASQDLASSYAMRERDHSLTDRPANVMPVYVRMSNPYRINLAELSYDEGSNFTKKYGGNEGFRKWLADNGYDGVIGYHDPEIAGQGAEFWEVVVFDPAQIKSAIGNVGTFDPSNPDIRFSRAGRAATATADVFERMAGRVDAATQDRHEIPSNWTPEQQAAASKFDTFNPKEPLADRVRRMREATGKKVVQKVFDQYRSLRDLSQKGYMQAHLARGAETTLDAVLRFGVPELRDGAVGIKTGTKGFIETLKKLGNQEEVNRFLMFVTAQRADALSREHTVYLDGKVHKVVKDQAAAAALQAQLEAAEALKPDPAKVTVKHTSRENLFTREDIDAMLKFADGTNSKGQARRILYAQVQREMNQFQKAILDIGQEAGVVNGESRADWESDFYIPFYRVMQDDNGNPTGQFSTSDTGLMRQEVIKRLKGGTENLGDPLNNLMANWTHMLEASMKNMAANNALDGAESMGIAAQVPKTDADGTMWTLRDGKRVYWEVADKDVLESLTALNFQGYNNGFMKAAGAFKRMLTMGVTINPTFRIRSATRDILHAMAVADVGYNPLKNAVEGWKQAGKDSELMKQMQAGGAAISFGLATEGKHGDMLRRRMKQQIGDDQVLNTRQKFNSALTNFYDWYMDLGDRLENNSRVAAYQRAMEKTGDHLIASFEGRDIMNFTSMGSSAAIRALAQVLPFFNARLQGMYKLGRGGKSDPRRFASVVGTIGMASALLYLLQADDDEYKSLPDYVRDTYWPIKLGDKWFYIPKPFEVGSMATVIERFTELAMAGGDYKARDFRDTVISILINNLEMNPVPQIILPAAEAWYNYDMFRGRPIDSMAMERLLPGDRYNANTSAGAVALGRAMNVSPQKIEHMVNGYFGWLGLQALSVSDLVARSFMDMPSSTRRDMTQTNNWFIVGDFLKESGSIASKYSNRFYDVQRDINQIYATANYARSTGDMERYLDLMSDPKMASRPMIRAATSRINRLNQQIRATIADRNLSAADKTARLRELHKRRSDIAKSVDEKYRG